MCGTSTHDGKDLPFDPRRAMLVRTIVLQRVFGSEIEPRHPPDDGLTVHANSHLSYLTSFDAKATPPKTPAFWDIVDANRAPEDAELADVLDEMGKPGSRGDAGSSPAVVPNSWGQSNHHSLDLVERHFLGQRS